MPIWGQFAVYPISTHHTHFYIYNIIYICLYELSGSIVCVFYITLICMYIIVLCNGRLMYANSCLTVQVSIYAIRYPQCSYSQMTYPSHIPLRVYIYYIHTFNG